MSRIALPVPVLAWLVVVALVLTGCADGRGTATGRSAPERTSERDALVVQTHYPSAALGLVGPRAFALGPDGNLYVTDRTDRVSVISPKGVVLRRWGGKGRAVGRFDFISEDPNDPADIHGQIAVAPTGEVFVGDSGNHRFEVFDLQGHFRRAFGGFGLGPGQSLQTWDVGVDQHGGVYTSDDQRETLDRVTPDGRRLWRVGGSTEQDIDLRGHLHIGTPDSHGRLLVANDVNSRVAYLDARGHKVDSFGTPGSPGPDGACDASVDAAGNVFVADCVQGGGVVYDHAHHMVGRWLPAQVALVKAPRFIGGDLAWGLARDGSVVLLRDTLLAGSSG